MIFNTPRPLFGRRPQAESFPTPIIGKARERRTAQLAEAADILDVLPGEGETLHALMTGRYDLMHLLAALIGKLGGCSAARIATLSYNERNLDEMTKLLDAGAVGTMTLLCSAFFRDHNKQLWTATLDEFRARGQRAAAARSHCKIICLACTDGRRYSLEGSANLRTNGNREQFALTQEATIHDWHAAWIDDLVSRHEGEAPP
jgi:hypothetical protein